MWILPAVIILCIGITLIIVSIKGMCNHDYRLIKCNKINNILSTTYKCYKCSKEKTIKYNSYYNG